VPNPRFSVITPVYNTDRKHLEECISSVIGQSFTDWELILIDDASSIRHVPRTLKKASELDDRVRVLTRETNAGIVGASNDGLAHSRGDFVMLLDHDDVLEPDALEKVNGVLNTDSELDYVYTDEGLITADGEFVDAFHKPDWSPERFRHQMYVCHLSTFRRSLAMDVGGFRPGFDGAQDYDLVFRIVERARKVGHVPTVLYHWRMAKTSVSSAATAKPYAYESGLRAIEAHLDRVRQSGVIDQSTTHPGTYRISKRMPSDTTVALYVPSAVEPTSVWGTTRDHRHETVRQLSSAPGLVLEVHTVDGQLNLARAFNAEIESTLSEIVIFTSPALEPLDPEWALEIIQPLADPTIGIVTGATYTANSCLEHIGYHLSGSFVERANFRIGIDDMGQRAILQTVFEVSAADWQCLAVKRALFRQLGGFDETLGHPWTVIDFCLRARALGQRTVANPLARFFEFTNNDDFAPRRFRAPKAFRAKWAEAFAVDPYRPQKPRSLSVESDRPYWQPMTLRDAAKARRRSVPKD